MPVSLSTIADAVGACCSVLGPLLWLLEAHVMAAERLHGDDTPVPGLALGKCDVGRCWVYVRDDKPFGGTAPPAAMSITRATAAARIRNSIWPTIAASSRPMRSADTPSSTIPSEVPD